MYDVMPHEYAWHMMKLYFFYYKTGVLIDLSTYIIPIMLILYGVKLCRRSSHP